MSDPFTLLGLPRRPWLTGEEIRTAFQERARGCHPDARGGDADAFAALNAAQAILADPAARLQFLAGATEANGMPVDREFGFRVGAVLKAVDDLLARAAKARNALERALLAREMDDARKSIAHLDLPKRLAAAEKKLQALDALWPDVSSIDLAALGTEFRFLQRWREQARERELALST